MTPRHLFRGVAATAAALVFAAAGGSAALADDIYNNLDLSVDAQAEIMSLNVGGSPGETTLYVVERNGDGKQGCNFGGQGNPSLTVSVASSNTAVATISPSSITFDACGDSQVVSVTPVSAGASTVSLTQTGNGTAGSFDLAPAKFTVNVAPAAPSNTAPEVLVTGVAGGARYEEGSVPAAVCSVEDAEDGPSSFAATLSEITGTLSALGLGSQTASCSYTDAGGLTASSSVTYSIVDTTAPALTLPANTTAEATGPTGAAVTFTATATDAVGPANPGVTCVPASGSTFPLGTTTVNCSATDSAGNTGNGSFTVTVQDTTAPAITWVGGPQDGASYVFGSVPAAGSCTAVDLVDPDATCTVSGYSTTVGVHTLTATATDDSGNTATETREYRVLAWTLNGFYSPVDMDGVLNVVKGGSTVPLKFEVFAGSTELTSTSAVKSFTQAKVSCDGTSPTYEIEVTSTGGTSLRYDSTGGQFIQNWQTPKAAGTCYKVTMTTQDGTALSALFRLK